MSRWPLALLLTPVQLLAQFTLYTCGNSTQNYVVGAKLPASGIFLRPPAGEWRHAGFNHPFVSAFDYDPRDPSVVYAAAGNGLLRVSENGERWKILTGSEVTELLDVAVDRNAPGTIYFAHTHGIQVTHDGGATWQTASAVLRRKYVAALRVDSRRAGVLLAGTEQGVFRSEDGGASWLLAGAAGLQVLHLEQSPHTPCFWLASTEGGGLFASTDCGATFESNGNLGVGRNLYDIAFDPATPAGSPLPDGVSASPSAKIAASPGSRATPASRPSTCGASPSIPRRPAGCSPACTRTPSMLPTTTAEAGAGTAFPAAPSSA